jgi:hypothetical protein
MNVPYFGGHRGVNVATSMRPPRWQRCGHATGRTAVGFQLEGGNRPGAMYSLRPSRYSVRKESGGVSTDCRWKSSRSSSVALKAAEGEPCSTTLLPVAA